MPKLIIDNVGLASADANAVDLAFYEKLWDLAGFIVEQDVTYQQLAVEIAKLPESVAALGTAGANALQAKDTCYLLVAVLVAVAGKSVADIYAANDDAYMVEQLNILFTKLGLTDFSIINQMITFAKNEQTGDITVTFSSMTLTNQLQEEEELVEIEVTESSLGATTKALIEEKYAEMEQVMPGRKLRFPFSSHGLGKSLPKGIVELKGLADRLDAAENGLDEATFLTEVVKSCDAHIKHSVGKPAVIAAYVAIKAQATPAAVTESSVLTTEPGNFPAPNFPGSNGASQ